MQYPYRARRSASSQRLRRPAYWGAKRRGGSQDWLTQDVGATLDTAP